jgi:hypothetical protein
MEKKKVFSPKIAALNDFHHQAQPQLFYKEKNSPGLLLLINLFSDFYFIAFFNNQL